MKLFSYLPAIVFTIALCACQPQHSTEKFVSISNAKVFTTDQGEGEVVLLLHGGLMDHTMWKYQIAELKNDYRVITVDLRGHGQSITGTTNYIQVDALAQILDSLAIQHASVVGHSLGAIVALDFALAYPEKTVDIVLIAPGLAGFNLNHDSLLNRYSKEMGEAYAKADTASFVESFMKAWYDGHVAEKNIDQSTRAYTKNIVTSTMKVNQWKYGPLFSESPADSSRLHEVKGKVLVICGDKDMEDILMISDLMDRKIHLSDKKIISGGAHMLPLTFPNELNELMKSFFKR